ncbi:MAG: AEC family transporter [Limisphaerales bacterium]
MFAIATLLALILLALLLKRRGFLEEAHGKMISRLVTNVTLPALVIVSLSRSRILWNELGLAMVMAGTGVACLALGWLIAKLLRLSRPQTAAVILASGFANASMLGFTIVAQIFPGDRNDLAEAVMLSGIGSQPIIFPAGDNDRDSFWWHQGAGFGADAGQPALFPLTDLFRLRHWPRVINVCGSCVEPDL